MKITFLGASQTVTGSSYLVDLGRIKFLVDMGMFQGVDVYYRNYEPLKFNAKEIDFVLLTHAHIDHSGLLPKLVKHGFNGPIFTCVETAQIVELLLLDSAKIQEFNSRVGKDSIYDSHDAIKAIRLLKTIKPQQKFTEKGVEIEFVPIGHILGACYISIKAEGKRVVFSGDIGRKYQSLIFPFDKYVKNVDDCDAVIMESLYGGKFHQDKAESYQQLLDVINKTISRYGNVIIPSFAVHRIQEIVEILKIFNSRSEINKSVQTFVDGKLARKITEIYTRSISRLSDDFDYKDEALSMTEVSGGNKSARFSFDELRYVPGERDFIKHKKGGPYIVLAGSGMAEGGRIVYHIKQNISNSNSSIVFVGFQAPGTLGYALANGEKNVRIDNEMFEVKAEVVYLHGFSAHGDNSDLTEWLSHFSKSIKKLFLVHSQLERSTAFKQSLGEVPYQVVVPEMFETHVID